MSSSSLDDGSWPFLSASLDEVIKFNLREHNWEKRREKELNYCSIFFALWREWRAGNNFRPKLDRGALRWIEGTISYIKYVRVCVYTNTTFLRGKNSIHHHPTERPSVPITCLPFSRLKKLIFSPHYYSEFSCFHPFKRFDWFFRRFGKKIERWLRYQFFSFLYLHNRHKAALNRRG